MDAVGQTSFARSRVLAAACLVVAGIAVGTAARADYLKCVYFRRGVDGVWQIDHF
jgi:hypothetical protein